MTDPLKEGLLGGQHVAFTGKLASMTRKEAAQLVRSHGGRFAAGVTRHTSLLVIGQEGWPLRKDGRLSNKLRKARLLHRRGRPITILTEESLLGRLRLDDQDSIHGRYSLAQLSRLLEVPGERLRSWVRGGLIQPVECVDGLAYFDFQQVASARTLCGLIRTGVTPQRLRRSFEQLGQWLRDPVAQPIAQPVAQVAQALAQVAVLEQVVAQGGRLFVRLDDGRLAEPTGQLQFDFPMTEGPPVVQPFQQPFAPLAPFAQARHEDDFEQGCSHETAGRWAEAVECYRAALAQRGPCARICFNLANAHYNLGRTGQAVERYRQAVEIDGNFAEAWNNLGNALADLAQLGSPGDVAEALAAFRRALELQPFYADAHYNLADLLDQLGRHGEARQHWQAYLKADAHTAHAAYARKRLQEARGAAR